MRYTHDAFRLYLRPLELSDHLISVKWRNDPEISKMVVGSSRRVSVEAEREWIEAAIKDSNVRLAVCEKARDRYIGNVYLTSMDQDNKAAEFSKLLGEKDVWSMGYGKEMTLLMLAYGFREMALHRIYARQLVSNVPSIKVNLKSGFENEGVAREAALKDGRFVDINLMGCLREGFESSWSRHISQYGKGSDG